MKKIIRFRNVFIALIFAVISIENVFANQCGLHGYTTGGEVVTGSYNCHTRLWCCNNKVYNECNSAPETPPMPGCTVVTSLQIEQYNTSGICSCGCNDEPEDACYYSNRDGYDFGSSSDHKDNSIYSKVSEKESTCNQLTITKVDKKSGSFIIGARIKVSKRSTYNRDEDSKFVDSTYELGSITLSQLSPGNYTIQEVSPPSGYSLDSTPISFSVDTDGRISVGSGRNVYRSTNSLTRNASISIGNQSEVCMYYNDPASNLGTSFKYADKYIWTTEIESYQNAGWRIAENVSKSDCNGCFGDTPTFARASKTVWATEKDSAHPYKYDERTTEGSCKALPEPKICTPQDYTGGQTFEETEKCEEERSIFYEDGKKCLSSTDDAFYEIKCVDKIANLFDLNKDNIEADILDIKQGQSFGYEIKSTSSKLCYAKFNTEVWKRAYDSVQAKFEALEHESKRVSEAEKAAANQWYITVQSKIFGQINEYLYWQPTIKKEPVAKVSLKLGSALQPLNNPKGNSPANNIVILGIDAEKNVAEVYDKKATSDGDIASVYRQYKEEMEKDYKGNQIFVKNSAGSREALDIASKFGIVVNGVETQPSFNVNLNSGRYVSDSMPSPAIDLSSVKNFLWFTSTKGETVLIPPEVSLDLVNGAIVGNGITPRLQQSGYNRIYTDTQIEKNNTYDLYVNLEKLGNNNSEVKNEKCKLRVLGRDFIYRVIEESNPFINNTRQKGYNWYRVDSNGTEYNFTSIIPNSNEYSKQYSLSPEATRIIKNSNSSTADAYLGTCRFGINDQASAILCR